MLNQLNFFKLYTYHLARLTPCKIISWSLQDLNLEYVHSMVSSKLEDTILHLVYVQRSYKIINHANRTLYRDFTAKKNKLIITNKQFEKCK
jgi:hypothetical protein